MPGALHGGGGNPRIPPTPFCCPDPHRRIRGHCYPALDSGCTAGELWGEARRRLRGVERCELRFSSLGQHLGHTPLASSSLLSPLVERTGGAVSRLRPTAGEWSFCVGAARWKTGRALRRGAPSGVEFSTFLVALRSAVAGLLSGSSTLLREPSAVGEPGGEGWIVVASPVVLCDGLSLCRALVAGAAGVASRSRRALAEVAAQQ